MTDQGKKPLTEDEVREILRAKGFDIDQLEKASEEDPSDNRGPIIMTVTQTEREKKHISRFTREELHEKFQALGVDDVEYWIETELDQGMHASLAPLVLFSSVWDFMVSSDDTAGLLETKQIVEQKLNTPGRTKRPEDVEFHQALEAVIHSGIDLKHISVIVRRMQEGLLYEIANDISYGESTDPFFEGISWGMFEKDEFGLPVRSINLLNEFIFEINPERHRHEKT